MPRKPIFDKAMTPAQRQRRHRAKKHAELASPDQSVEEWLLSMRLQPGDLVPFDPEDFES